MKHTITSIAIGGFDGMHLAHQELFKKLDKNGAIVVISTGYANLSPFVNRANYTSFPLFYYPLANIKHLNGKEFIDLLNEEFVQLKKIIVGYDFHFGSKAAYNTDDLKKLFLGEVEIVKEYKIENTAVHSKIIRKFLNNGEIHQANKFLGYPYKLIGRHIKGQGLGSKQFVPTININVEEFLIPQSGIYITKTIVNNQSYQSVSFIGHRVTTDGKFAVETHIIDKFDDKMISNQIAIEFHHKIRDNKKFEIYDELKMQILDDIEKSKIWFKKEKDKK